MPKVEYQRLVDVPSGKFEAALEAVLRGISGRIKPWDDFALHLAISDIGLPDVGYITVPIKLNCAREIDASGQFQMTLHIEAQKNRASFPLFDGHCGVSVLNASRCNFWLGGGYTVPLKSFGIFFDATLLHGAADRCLCNFVDDVVEACKVQARQEFSEFSSPVPDGRLR